MELHAQPQPVPRQPPPNPTNLKVRKATTGAEVTQIMHTFTAGLGVQCTYCHMQGNYVSDDNPKKDAARKMIVMAQKINAEFQDGKMHVSCYICHRWKRSRRRRRNRRRRRGASPRYRTPPVTFQSLMVFSPPDASRRPSGLKARAVAALSWPG